MCWILVDNRFPICYGSSKKGRAVVIWIFTRFGFFSVTEVKEYPPPTEEELLNPRAHAFVVPPLPIQPPGTLQVRARVREDLDNLRTAYLPELSETVHVPGRDYPYRAFVTREALGVAMYNITLDIDYNNFKSEVMREQGWSREVLYSRVWGVMHDAEKKLEEEDEKERKRALRKETQGSLLHAFDRAKVWLKDPVGEYIPSEEDLQFPPGEGSDPSKAVSLLQDLELENALFDFGQREFYPVKEKRRRRKKARRDRRRS